MVVTLVGQFAPSKPYTLPATALAVTICPSYTLGRQADWRQECPWMSKTSVPPSVLRPNSVIPDCCRVLSYWGAPALTSHATIGDNVSAGALSLSP